MKAEDDCFLAGKRWQTQTVCWKAETLLDWQKVCMVKDMVFPVVTHLWELDSKEGRIPKNWCLWTVVHWKRLLRVPWRTRRSNQSILRETNPEYLLEGLRLKLQYFGHLMWTVDSLEKSAGKDWGQKEKRASEKEMAAQHHWRNEHELGQTPGDDEGQGSLACCSPQGHKQPDITGRLNNNNSGWMDRWVEERMEERMGGRKKSNVNDKINIYTLEIMIKLC